MTSTPHVIDITTVAEYSVTDARIAELKEQYSGLQIKNKDDYKVVLSAISKVRNLRSATEKARKEFKRGALEWGRKVDSEAKRIMSELLEIEEPLKAEKQKIDDKKKRIQEEKDRKEQERIAAIHTNIAKIRTCGEDLLNKDSTYLQSVLNRVSAIVITGDEYHEFIELANDAVAETIAVIDTVLDERLLFEHERKELEIQKKQQAEEQAEFNKEREAEVQRRREDDARLEAERQKMETAAIEAAREQAEREAKEGAERELQERLEREAAAKLAEEAEAKRLEALRPDLEKLALFCAKISRVLDEEAPGITDETLASEMRLMVSQIMAAIATTLSKGE